MSSYFKVPSIQQPQHPFAKLLVLVASAAIFVLLNMCLGFLCRELMLDVFVPEEIDGVMLPGGDVMEMWLMGIRFDLQMGAWFAMPLIVYAGLTFMFGELWQWVNRGMTLLVGVLFFIIITLMMVNFHYMMTTGQTINWAAIDTFMANPDWGYIWDNYSVLYSGFFAILFSALMAGLWKRFAYMLGNWDCWHSFTVWHMAGIPFLLAYLFLMFAQNGMASDRLTADEARVSTVESINQIVMSAPSILYYDESRQK